jgi:hypothetical protein
MPANTSIAEWVDGFQGRHGDWEEEASRIAAQLPLVVTESRLCIVEGIPVPLRCQDVI